MKYIFAEFKAQLFLLIGTVVIIVALFIYNPQPRVVLQHEEERIEESIVEWNDYITAFDSYGFDCRKIIYHDGYCIFEVIANYYTDINIRLEDIVSVLHSWDEYPDDIRIWVLKESNTEVVEYIYEDGVVERYGR